MATSLGDFNKSRLETWPVTRMTPWVSTRALLFGLGLGTGFATMRWSRVAAAEDPVVQMASGKVRGALQPGVTIPRIRYGESTGGRFLPPVAAKPWGQHPGC
jgi:hypothetical protein